MLVSHLTIVSGHLLTTFQLHSRQGIKSKEANNKRTLLLAWIRSVIWNRNKRDELTTERMVCWKMLCICIQICKIILNINKPYLLSDIGQNWILRLLEKSKSLTLLCSPFQRKQFWYFLDIKNSGYLDISRTYLCILISFHSTHRTEVQSLISGLCLSVFGSRI